MKTLTYGMELETIGRTRNQTAKTIQKVTGGQVVRATEQTSYDPWDVIMPDGRHWRVMCDGSLSGDRNHQCEVVSPILKYEDLEMVQNVVRALRTDGSKVDQSCGIHIHIGAAPFNANAIRNLAKTVNKQEALIEKALGIQDRRICRWCREVDHAFLERIDHRTMTSMEQLRIAWYGHNNHNLTHYDSSRYHGLNLHSVFYRGTIEFRWFEATLHAGVVKSYIQFALALAAKALHSKAASSAKREFNPATAKYDFRVFLLHLGLIGDEFKTARFHLLSKLGGSAAWKGERRDRRPATVADDNHGDAIQAAA